MNKPLVLWLRGHVVDRRINRPPVKTPVLNRRRLVVGAIAGKGTTPSPLDVYVVVGFGDKKRPLTLIDEHEWPICTVHAGFRRRSARITVIALRGPRPSGETLRVQAQTPRWREQIPGDACLVLLG